MRPRHKIFLHRVFLREIDDLAPGKSRLRRQINEALHAASQNPRGPEFKKLWIYHWPPYEVVTWRAHVGGRSGHRLILGLYQHVEQRQVQVVPLQLSRLRKDEGFRYRHKQLEALIGEFSSDFVNHRPDLFQPWTGSL